MRHVLKWALALTPVLLVAASAVSREPHRGPRTPFSIVDSVSAARIEADVRRLALHPDGTPRSRFTARPEYEAEAVAFADSVFRANLAPGDTVTQHRWRWVTGDGDTLRPANLVGIHRGTHPGLGAYILCAHMDATGTRTAGWNRHTDPAPGADDNASGTAAVLEAVRVLGQESFDFDLYFVLFSGEELGLLGSIAFAESLAFADAPLYGVFNFDMISYRKEGEPLEIEALPNRLSQWMTDLMARRQSEIGEEVTGIRFTPTPPRSLQNSDQAAFWRYGYDALLLIEKVDAGAYNPNYHKITDLPDGYETALRYDQAAGILKLVIGTLDGFRQAPQGVADFVVHPDQISFTVDGRRLEDLIVEPGQEVVIATAALAQGASHDGAIWGFEFRSGSATLPVEATTYIDYLPAGAVVRDSVVWVPDESDAGLHIISARVREQGLTENDISDNIAADTLLVRSARLKVLEHFVYPNPVALSTAAGGLGGAHLRIVAGRPGRASVEIFDLSGRRLGRTAEEFDVAGAFVDVPLSSVVDEDRLAAGMYFYRVRVRAGGAEASEMGRFALLR